MTGRSLSLFALVGSLATLVLVATLAGEGDVAPPQDTVVPISTAVMETTTSPIPMPRSRAIHSFVRQQSDADRVMLASYER